MKQMVDLLILLSVSLFQLYCTFYLYYILNSLDSSFSSLPLCPLCYLIHPLSSNFKLYFLFLDVPFSFLQIYLVVIFFIVCSSLLLCCLFCKHFIHSCFIKYLFCTWIWYLFLSWRGRRLGVCRGEGGLIPRMACFLLPSWIYWLILFYGSPVDLTYEEDLLLLLLRARKALLTWDYIRARVGVGEEIFSVLFGSLARPEN